VSSWNVEYTLQVHDARRSTTVEIHTCGGVAGCMGEGEVGVVEEVGEAGQRRGSRRIGLNLVFYFDSKQTSTMISRASASDPNGKVKRVNLVFGQSPLTWDDTCHGVSLASFVVLFSASNHGT